MFDDIKKDYVEYIDAITSVFDKYSKNVIVTLGNKSIAYIGTVR